MSDTSVLRDRSLRALLLAEVISMSGAQMTWLALPWFVLATTGSATQMTLVMAAEIAAYGVLGLPAGKLLGRLGARRTMLVCDATRAPVMLLIPALHWADALTFPFLLVVAFVLGGVSAPYFAAQKVIVPELLGEDEARVGQANALFQAAQRTTLLLGPVLGGVLIGVIGATPVLVVDAATYVVSFALVAAFVPRRPPLAPDGEDRGIRAGIRFILRDRLLRVLSPVFAIGDAAWMAFFAAVPVLVVARFGSDARVAGLLFASFGIGAVAGNAIAYRYLLDRVDGMTLIATAIMGQALPLWLLTLDVPGWVLCSALIASGVANGLVNPSIHTLTTLRPPPALRPTVMTTMMVVWTIAQPLGLFGAGPVLDRWGAEPILVALAATQTVTMAIVAVVCLRERARASYAPLPA